MTYAEKLKDPRWQKKRLEIMEAANFECSNCGDKESTLNVHHTRYIKGLNPWEYDNAYLDCLCDNCHEKFHSLDNLIQDKISFLTGADREELFGYLLGIEMLNNLKDQTIESYEAAGGFAAYWKIDVEELIEFLCNHKSKITFNDVQQIIKHAIPKS